MNSNKSIENLADEINEIKEHRLWLIKRRLAELEAMDEPAKPVFKSGSRNKHKGTSHWCAEQEARERNQSLLN